MKHAMRKYLTVLLCAALLLGVFCPAAAAGKPTERAASGDLAGVASDPAKTIYATSEETTLVPAGYTYVYTGKNGETYTQTAESDLLVTPRVLTAEEAEALASLQHGEPKTVVAAHDQEEALTMSDTIVVMNQGYIQQMGTPEQIYNEPENAFVADFIGESNIADGLMLRDELVEISGAKFACVDKGFGVNKPVDVVIRPEDIDLVEPEAGTLKGVVTHLIFKGVHYEMEVTTPDGYEWLVHSTDMFPVGKEVGIRVDPFDIQIMNKPASEDEEAVGINE